MIKYVISSIAISIRTPTGKRLYSCFNLCSNGILSDSTYIRSIISISPISSKWWLFSVFLRNLERNDVTCNRSILVYQTLRCNLSVYGQYVALIDMHGRF